ncbi:MAG: thioredoxin [Chthoniobacterales bacterium]|nr:thioredoxin [Chthoniobacterales bacterium]
MSTGNVLEVTESEFADIVLQSSIPVLVDFWAPWCGPCRQIAPLIEDIAKQYEGKLRVVKVNVDVSPKLATEYGINAIPALFIFKGGEVHSKSVGLGSRAELVRRIEATFG